MPIRLLAIDLDGTLLTDEREPHPENIAAVRRAMDAGIRVVLSSGRTSLSMQRFADVLGLDGAMISNNGAHVTGLGGVELLHVGLSVEAIRRTFDYVNREDVHISGYTRDAMFVIQDSKWLEMYLQRVRVIQPILTTEAELRSMKLLKIILIDHPERIKNHHRDLGVDLADIAFLTESEPEYLEVLSTEANKGKGLAALSASLGIAQHETAAIGDYLNDLEMVEWAGVGAAVGNAVAELKDAADVVMPTNNDAGVARFVEYVIDLNLREVGDV